VDIKRFTARVRGRQARNIKDSRKEVPAVILLIHLLVGHLLGDFVFQTMNLSKLKTEKVRYLLLHIFLVFLSLLITSLGYLSFKFIICLILIAVIHVIDWVKKYTKTNIVPFFLDQAIHLSSLVLIPGAFGMIDLSKAYRIMLLLNNNKIVWIYIAGYLAGVFAGRIAIQVLINKITPSSNNSNGSNTSAYIGMVERLIVITLAILNQYTAIGIIFAIKGAARKGFMESTTENGEFYFLGTGLSFAIGILTAIAINFLVLHMP
jgi:hypothetical protein